MYTIHEVCERTGLTEKDLDTLGVICCLKNTGMSLQDISRFMMLAREGNQTLRERCELLKKHRDTVIARMEEMQRYLDKVTWKVNFYTEKLAEYERDRE